MSVPGFDNVFALTPKDVDKHTIPEAEFISALIDTGAYAPSRYGIKDEYILSFMRVHTYCLNWQAVTGKAPDIAVVRRKFTFPYTQFTDPAKDVYGAAAGLVEEWRKREIRRTLNESAALLTHPDTESREVLSLLSDAASRLTVGHHQAKGFEFGDFTFDSSLSDTRAAIELRPGTLTAATGGIAIGEFWVVAAYAGVGKSWRMAEMAVAAAASGWNVHLHSLEMGPRAMFNRIGLIALGLGVAWTQMPYSEQVHLARGWSQDKGRITIIPQRKRQLCAMDIEATAAEGTVYLVDYVGKMRTNDGKSTTDDWRNFLRVSEELQVVAQTCEVPIIGAAQLNKDAAGHDKPTNDMIGGTVGLEQDASCVILLSELSRRAQYNQLSKNRNGSKAQWYSILEPGTGTFGEITKRQALTLKESDSP